MAPGDRFCERCGQAVGQPFVPFAAPPVLPKGLDPATYLELASWGRRAAGYLIDFLVVLLVVGGIAVGTGFALARTLTRPDGSTITGDSGWGALVIVVEVVVGSIAYFGLLNGLAGRTVGMRVVGIEVRDASGVGRIGCWRASGRFAILYGAWLIPFPGAAPLAIALDLCSPLWDRRRQAWHDKLFRSIVVRRRPTP